CVRVSNMSRIGISGRLRIGMAVRHIN
ncbi:MAG: hypothetical protein QOJ14_2229, partial [Thermoleophilaceae bacterium]|nr:hypothetical protein [Thermoleophilaceae bacterium]